MTKYISKSLITDDENYDENYDEQPNWKNKNKNRNSTTNYYNYSKVRQLYNKLRY